MSERHRGRIERLMLAGLLRMTLAIVGLLAVIAGVVGYGVGGRPMTWFVAVLLAFVFAIGLVVLFSFAWSMLRASSRPRHLRVSLVAWLQMVVIEWAATVRWYALWQVFPRRFILPKGADPTGGTRPPVLLVHGYFCNGAVWSRFQRWLSEFGRSSETVSLEPVLGSIEEMAATLKQRIDSLRVTSGDQMVDIVAHSMGGLVTRTAIRRFGADGIRSVTTLGTPHHGTSLARIALGRCGKELKLGSTLIRQLNEVQPMAPSLPGGFMSILTYDDNLVAPQDTARLDGADNVPISGVGHASLLTSPKVFALVRERLETLDARALQPQK